MVTLDFLKEKSRAIKGIINEYQNPNYYDAGNVNINRITDNVFNFEIQYYINESDDDIKSGHYEVYVNIKTFEFVIFEQWLDPDGNHKQIKNLSEFTTKKLESYVANKLIGSYFYVSSSFDCNMEGSNLFPDPEYIERYTKLDMTSHRTGNNIIKDGEKRSLITDYRGYIWSDMKVHERSEMDKDALSQIDKLFVYDSLESIELVKKLYSNQVNNFGKNVLIIKCVVSIKTKNGRELTLYFRFYGMSRDIVIVEGDNKICAYYMSESERISDYYKIIPKIIENL